MGCSGGVEHRLAGGHQGDADADEVLDPLGQERGVAVPSSTVLGGRFVLRIDDTDAERNVEAALAPIAREAFASSSPSPRKW